MRRRLFTLLSALSLLLFVAVCVLWVRSYWRWDSLAHRHGNASREVSSASGSIIWLSMKFTRTWSSDLGWRYASEPAEATMSFNVSNLFKVQWQSHAGGRSPVRYTSWTISVPYTYPALLTLVLPLLWFIPLMRGRRHHGLCPSCGYDLRATPGRCPECGAVPARSSA